MEAMRVFVRRNPLAAAPLLAKIRNEGAMHSAQRAMEQTPGLKITMPYVADDGVVEGALRKG